MSIGVFLIFTLIGKGNLAMSVAYNAVSCLVSPVSMTIVFLGYSHVLGGPFAFAAPGWRLVFAFFLLITAPIVAGAGLRHARILNFDRISRFLRIGCLSGVFALCTYIVVSRFDQLKTDWKFAGGASILLAFPAMMIGWTVSKVLRMKQQDSLTLFISFSVRKSRWRRPLQLRS